MRLDTIKLLEENTGRTFFDINHSNNNPFQPISESNEKKKKWDLIKLQSFSMAKDTIKKIKTTYR